MAVRRGVGSATKPALSARWGPAGRVNHAARPEPLRQPARALTAMPYLPSNKALNFLPRL